MFTYAVTVSQAGPGYVPGMSVAYENHALLVLIHPVPLYMVLYPVALDANGTENRLP